MEHLTNKPTEILHASVTLNSTLLKIQRKLEIGEKVDWMEYMEIKMINMMLKHLNNQLDALDLVINKPLY